MQEIWGEVLDSHAPETRNKWIFNAGKKEENGGYVNQEYRLVFGCM